MAFITRLYSTLQRKVCKATRTLRLASQRFLKLRLRGFMIIKLFQEGLRELLREASRTALRSYLNTSFSFAKVIEAKASWFHDFQEGLRELLREASRTALRSYPKRANFSI